MSSPRVRWNRGIQLQRQQSVRSNSAGEVRPVSDTFNDKDLDMEVGAYVARLKQKTGLRSLWSGNKFKSYVDGDRTPDVSISSDEDVHSHLEANLRNLRNLPLDSDEDELRIDFMREERRDEGASLSVKSSGSDASSLMHNIRFAELGPARAELSDKQVSEESKDFLPNIRLRLLDDSNGGKPFGSADFLFGRDVRDADSDVVSEISPASKSVTQSQQDVDDFSDQSGGTNRTADSGQPITEDISADDASSVISHVSLRRVKNRRSSKTVSSVSSSSAEDSIKMASQLRSAETNQTSSSRRSRRSSALSYSEDSVTLASTSGLLSEPAQRKVSAGTVNSAQSSRVTPRRGSKAFDKQTQTDVRSEGVDVTREVLQFRHSWQAPQATSILPSVFDGQTLDAYSTFNPSAIALHDLMKFHLQLIRSHIDSSRRLYESYACENMNCNYRYETLQNTMKYIEQNRPKVPTYEEALNEVLDHR